MTYMHNNLRFVHRIQFVAKHFTNTFRMSKKITKTAKTTKAVKAAAKTVKKAPVAQPAKNNPKAKAKIAKTKAPNAERMYALFDCNQFGNSTDAAYEMDYAFRGLYKSLENAINEFIAQKELSNDLQDLESRDGEIVATLHDVEEAGWKIMPMRLEVPTKSKAAKQPAKSEVKVPVKKAPAKKKVAKAKKPKAFTGPLPKILSIGFLTDDVLAKYVPNLKNATKLDVELTWQPRIHTVDVDISVWYKSAKSSTPIEGEDGSNEDLANDLYDAIRATLMSRFSAAPNMGPSEAEAFFEREAAPLFETTRKLTFDTSTGSDS